MNPIRWTCGGVLRKASSFSLSSRSWVAVPSVVPTLPPPRQDLCTAGYGYTLRFARSPHSRTRRGCSLGTCIRQPLQATPPRVDGGMRIGSKTSSRALRMRRLPSRPQAPSCTRQSSSSTPDGRIALEVQTLTGSCWTYTLENMKKSIRTLRKTLSND